MVSTVWLKYDRASVARSSGGDERLDLRLGEARLGEDLACGVAELGGRSGALAAVLGEAQWAAELQMRSLGGVRDLLDHAPGAQLRIVDRLVEFVDRPDARVHAVACREPL